MVGGGGVAPHGSGIPRLRSKHENLARPGLDASRGLEKRGNRKDV